MGEGKLICNFGVCKDIGFCRCEIFVYGILGSFVEKLEVYYY